MQPPTGWAGDFLQAEVTELYQSNSSIWEHNWKSGYRAVEWQSHTVVKSNPQNTDVPCSNFTLQYICSCCKRRCPYLGHRSIYWLSKHVQNCTAAAELRKLVLSC